MNKIKQLPPHEAQKIAAGEVVERPANVVKELIENAIDAGSTTITLSIEDGGKKLIRVVDNGSGMSAVDARLSIAHHATSKITSISDLETITTFGFRGEALSSIVSVAKVTLSTQEQDNLEGVTLSIENGSIIEELPYASVQGTDIAVRDLFYNVPARKKFLKTKETEVRAITQFFQAMCLAHPEIYFSFFSDNRSIYNCPPVATIHDRVLQLYDQKITDSILVLPTTTEKNITISGAITNHQYHRYDKQLLFIFVNKRWIKNYKLVSALLKGYAQVLPADKYPAGFIFIELPATEVDINTHPRKEEVQFLHPRIVETRLTEIINQTLNKYTIITTPSIVASSFKNAKQLIEPPIIQERIYTKPIFEPVFKREITPATATPISLQTTQPTKTVVKSTPPIITPPAKERNYTLLGQLHKTFILVQKDEGLLLIDAHAAHERVLYEQFATRFQELPTVGLLFPQIITVSTSDRALLEKHSAIFTNYGIDLEVFGEQQIRINATPVALQKVNLEKLIQQVIAWIHEHETIDQKLFFTKISEHMRALMACKAAVKGGDNLSVEQMHELIQQLELTPNRLTCPHGRPTCWLISMQELEKKFKRII